MRVNFRKKNTFSIWRVLGRLWTRPAGLAPEIDAGWSLGMPGTTFDVPSGLPTDLWPISDPLHKHWISDMPDSLKTNPLCISRYKIHAANWRLSGTSMIQCLWRGSGMDHRSVGRPAGTSNIVPGMPGDHPASIPGPRGSPGAPQRHRCPSFISDTFFKQLVPSRVAPCGFQ